MGLPCQWSVKETKLRTVSQPIKHEISWCRCMTTMASEVWDKLREWIALCCEENLFMPWFVYIFWGPKILRESCILYLSLSWCSDFSWNVSSSFVSCISLSNCMQRIKGYNVQGKLILKYCKYYMLFKIISEKIICSRYLIHKFLLFLPSHLKVHSTSCFEASSSLRTLLSISLVIVPMFPCASGEREVCREG